MLICILIFIQITVIMTSIYRDVSVADVTDDNNTDSQKNISDNGSIIESPIEEAKPKTIENTATTK